MRQVIIGNSAASLSALKAIRKFDGDCQVSIICDEKSPAYSRPLLPYYIGGKIGEGQLFIYGEKQYRDFHVDTVFGKKVVGVHPRVNTVYLDDGSSIEYDNLLIATGASAVIPRIEGINIRGIFTLRNLSDAQGILSYSDKCQDVLMLGAGLINLKLAEILLSKKGTVTLVDIANQVLAQQLDLEAASLIETRAERLGANVIKQRHVVRITPLDGWRKKVILDDGEEIEADLIIVGVGIVPNISFLDGSGININHGILTNRAMRTDYENIFAAGDVAECEDFISGDRVVPGTWNAAVEQGKVAGCNMVGMECSYLGGISANIMELFGLTFASVGLARATENDYQVLIHSDPSQEIYRKIVVKKDKIVGGILLGKLSDCGIIYSMLRKRVSLHNFTGAVIKNGLDFGRIISLLRVGRQNIQVAK